MSLCNVSKGTNNTNIGSRFFQLRNKIGLSLDALSYLTGISKATLSRIENGSMTFEYLHIKTLVSVFGISEPNIHSSEFNVPSEDEIKNGIKKYLRKNKPEISYAELFRKKPGATFYVDKILEGDFLNKKRTMKEITDFCRTEFNVVLVGSHITNILKRRMLQGLVEITQDDYYKGFYYRKIK